MDEICPDPSAAGGQHRVDRYFLWRVVRFLANDQVLSGSIRACRQCGQMEVDPDRDEIRAPGPQVAAAVEAGRAALVTVLDGMVVGIAREVSPGVWRWDTGRDDHPYLAQLEEEVRTADAKGRVTWLNRTVAP